MLIKPFVKKNFGKNVIVKARVEHPAVSFYATAFRGKDGVFISGPSFKGSRGGWINAIKLNETCINMLKLNFKEFFARKQAKAEGKDFTPKVSQWYKKFNDLGIYEIEVSTNLSKNQREAGVVANVTLNTNIGTITGASVFAVDSGLIVSEQRQKNDGNTYDLYELSPLCKSQILNKVEAILTKQMTDNTQMQVAQEEKTYEVNPNDFDTAKASESEAVTEEEEPEKKNPVDLFGNK